MTRYVPTGTEKMAQDALKRSTFIYNHCHSVTTSLNRQRCCLHAPG